MKNINQSNIPQTLINRNGKSKNIYRTTSDNLVDIFDLWLQKWNVIIIDWLKYRYNWKDMFVIDKNAKKSADIQWRQYKEVIKFDYSSYALWNMQMVVQKMYPELKSIKDTNKLKEALENIFPRLGNILGNILW